MFHKWLCVSLNEIIAIWFVQCDNSYIFGDFTDTVQRLLVSVYSVLG